MQFGAIVLTIGDEIRRRRNSSHNSSSNNNELSAASAVDISSAYSYMLGRFARLNSLSHPNLCRYFELNKCQTVPNGFMLISEHHCQPFVQHDCFLNSRIGTSDSSAIFSVALQICSAMEFCHKRNLAITGLCLDNVLVVDVGSSNREQQHQIHVKLTHYGICYVAGDYFSNGDHRSAISAPSSQAPEFLFDLLPPNRGDQSACSWADIWSFGILLIELFTGWRLAELLDRRRFLAVLGEIICRRRTGSVCADLLDAVCNSCPAFAKKRSALDPVYALIEKCLQISPLTRPTAAEVLAMLREAGRPFLRDISELVSNGGMKDDGVDLDEDIDAIRARLKRQNELEMFGFSSASTLPELFFLWKLCGTSVENILTRKGVIRTRPPISTMPSLLVENCQMYGNEETRRLQPPLSSTLPLPMNNLLERFRALPYDKLTLSLELQKRIEEEQKEAQNDNDFDENCNNGNGHVGDEEEGMKKRKKKLPMEEEKDKEEEENGLGAPNQSLVVKERDIEYQFQRMRLFRRLLAAWPNKAALLRVHSRRDIPPVYRGPVWAALLGVLPFSEDGRAHKFYALDTLSEHISDRQLQVDIPRCHQYDDLMSSPMAHYQMKVLLKALLVSRKEEFVYWQGLDSLSAPFLILHFNDLPTAFRCLNAFIDRYLRGFFHRDNSTVIRNYLAEFMRVIEFCDQELFFHLISLDFHPELFAIPWFLTCFAHVLPLHKLFHLWDALLLADAEFPLFIGVAILLQLRSRLISASFNEAILLFSDLPDLPIDDVVNSAKFFYNKWRAAETSNRNLLTVI